MGRKLVEWIKNGQHIRQIFTKPGPLIPMLVFLQVELLETEIRRIFLRPCGIRIAGTIEMELGLAAQKNSCCLMRPWVSMLMKSLFLIYLPLSIHVCSPINYFIAFTPQIAQALMCM